MSSYNYAVQKDVERILLAEKASKVATGEWHLDKKEASQMEKGLLNIFSDQEYLCTKVTDRYFIKNLRNKTIENSLIFWHFNF